MDRSPAPRLFAAALALAMASATVWLFPEQTFRLFSGGAAWILKLLLGVPLEAAPEGWLIGAGVWPRPVLVTRACSATDYFSLLAPLLAWRLGTVRSHFVLAALQALAVAVPFTLAINVLRIATVVQAHLWVIPRFPPVYGDFLHLLTGVVVFLPSLLVLDFVFQKHAHAHLCSRARRA